MLSDVSSTQIGLTLGILLLAYLIYSRIVKPYRQYYFYKGLVTANYKTYVYPFTLTPFDFIKESITNMQKYGDAQYSAKFIYRHYQMILRMFVGRVCIDIVEPQLIRQFYEKTVEGYYIKFQQGVFIPSFTKVIGKGLLLSEQNLWRNKRKIMSSVFNYDFLKSKVKMVSNIAIETLDKIQKNQPSQHQVIFNVNQVLQQMFGNAVIKCFFGDIQLHDIQGEPVFHFFNRLMEMTIQRCKSPLNLIFGAGIFEYNLRPIDRKLSKMSKDFDQYAAAIITSQIEALSKAKQQNDTSSTQASKMNGLIQLLVKSGNLRNQDQNTAEQSNSVKGYYNIPDLIDEFKTFFFAGNDTTSNNTTVLLYHLAKRRDILQKLREQIAEVIANDLSNITYQKLKQFKYMEKVQKESLRMYPPTTGLFRREATKDHYIGNIPIKKGTLVTPVMLGNHFKQEFYKNPQIFDPERWGSIDSSKVDAYSFYPFSSGPRNCIGQHLALIQGKIALILLLTRYKDFKPEKSEFQVSLRTIYGPENMNTTFYK